MSLTKDEALEFHNGKIRIINPEGKTLSEFIAQDFMKYLEEKTYEWTYAKFAYLKGLGWPKGIVQVGPTARMNVNSRANTGHANKELREFRRKFGSEVKPRRGRGIGVVEAPRGTLAHEYTLTRNGRLKRMKLIIPTQVNNAAINLNVKDAAMEFIQHGEIKPGLLNRIEMVIRAYDPCIKCATRLTNEKLRVEIRNSKGELLRTLEN